MKRALSLAGATLAVAASLLAGTAPASVTPATIEPNVQVSTRDALVPSQDFRSPVIAVNPTNAASMVMVARTDEPDYFCRIYHSTDGGATWTAATGSGPTFPDPPLPAGSPAGKTSGTCWSPGVAFDSTGKVYVVAQDRPNGGGGPQTVIVWKSTNGGQSFGAPLTIPGSTTSGFSVQADVAIDANPASPYANRIYVTWHEFPTGPLTAVLTHSDDGVNWTPPIQRSIPGQSQTIPDLTVAPDGTVYDIFKTASPFGSGGTDCVGIGGGTPPAAGTNCPVQILRSSSGGASFDADPFTVGTTFFPGGAENAVVDTAVAEEPSLVVTPTGTLLVAVSTVPKTLGPGCAASLQAVVYRSTNRGQTWSGPQTLNDDPCASGNEHRDPRLSVAPNGRIDVAFYDNRLDPSSHIPADPAKNLLYDIQYANSTDDGVTFGPNTRLSTASSGGTKLFATRPSGSPPNAFQSRDYDTVTGLASLNGAVVAAWGDTRAGGAADLFSTRITAFVTPPPPPPPPVAPPPPPAPPPGPEPDTTRPEITGLRATPVRFTIGSALARLDRAAKGGTTIRFSLSEQAAVRLSFAREAAGRRVGSSCRKATRALLRRPRCTRYVTVGPSVRFAAVGAGAHRVAFHGRLSRTRALLAGRYRLTATATDLAGNRSDPKRTSLTATSRLRRP